MELILLLLSAHFIGDFYLQPDSWVASRHQLGLRSAALYRHAGVHAVLSITALWLAGIKSNDVLFWAGVITLTHFIIDWAKAGYKTTLAFGLDQAAHILVLLVVAAVIGNMEVADLRKLATQQIQSDTLLYFLGYLIIFKPASIIIGLLLAPHAEKIKDADNQSLGNAGRWIGYVERLLALSFILVDEYTGLGFLVATKTVFRVGDLSRQRDMRLTEYMMLGTLMSFAIALIVGWILVAANQTGAGAPTA